MRHPTILMVALAAGLLGLAGPVAARDPEPTDIRACNEEARDAVKAGTAAPTAKDRARAEAERAGRAPASAESADPQLIGLDAARAGDPAYQAAYRVCMRRNGF